MIIPLGRFILMEKIQSADNLCLETVSDGEVSLHAMNIHRILFAYALFLPSRVGNSFMEF